jgi:hypothetical protein
MKNFGSLFLSLVGRRGLVILVLLVISALGAWGYRRYRQLEALYAAISTQIVEKNELLVAKDASISDLSENNRDLALELRNVRRGAVIETHGTASLTGEVRAGAITRDGTTYTWQDNHGRFRFHDPDLEIDGNELFASFQQFRLETTTVRLPDRSYATRAKLFEVSPATGDDLTELFFDHLDSSVVDFDSGKTKSFWSRFTPYVGTGLAYNIDGEVTFDYVQVGYGMSLKGLFHRKPKTD